MATETRRSVARRSRRALHQQYLPDKPPERAPRPWPEGGLFPGEPESCRRSLRPFLRNFVFLGLLLVVFKVYRLEERAFPGRAFQTIATIAFLALPLHYLAPFRWKKPLFIAISMTGMFWV